MATAHYIVLVLHGVSSLIASSYCYFDRLTHKLTRYLSHLVRHSSRKEPSAFFLRGMRENSGNIFIEAHIEHFVGFVQHTIVDMTDIYEVTAYHILHTPRSSHDNLCAFFEATRLFLNTCTAIYRHYVHFREVLSIIAEFRSDLQAEFACR